jgi:AcrR family transcriptional regulator
MAYEATGRTNQKQRTREALVSAARDLVAQGLTPTVEQAATSAGISRTTAYRYFTAQRSLLAAAHPETAATSLLPADVSDDPRERLDAVVTSFISSTLANESQQRTMLRLSLEATPEERAELPLRQGRAIGWIEEALAPLRATVPSKELRRLVLAIRATAGIEALVWLTDVAGMTRDEAVELMRWSALSLLDQTAAESKARSARRPAKRRR